jgi:hypothetical protein
MSLPNTIVNLGNNALGRLAATEDGTSGLILTGVAVAGKFALGDVLGPFTSLTDAEDKGITAAYDTTNVTVAHKHIKDFYKAAPVGTKLYVMVVAMTQTLTTSCLLATTNGLKKLLSTTGGNIKMVGVTFTPDGTYTPTYQDQLEADLWTALTNLKATWDDEFLNKRPFRAFVEARNWQGTPSTIKDMRASGTTPNVPQAVVVLGNDFSYDDPSASVAVRKKYASVGMALGCAAALKVNRNIGRVKNGATKCVNAGFSNGSLLSTVSESNQGLLNDKGYVFFRTHNGKSGFFWNDDHTACPLTSDYAQLTLGRTMDKAIRIAHVVNTEEILDELFIDGETGKLDVSTVKHYQNIIDTEINAQMTSNSEIIKVETYVDPDQNVLATSKLKEVIKITPTANARVIESTIEYTNPSTN